MTAVVVWTKVVGAADNVNAAIACTPPAGGISRVGQPLPHDALNKVVPTPPAEIQVRVLNAGGQRGAAQQVTYALEGLGFQQAGQPQDDSLYPQQNMRCQGQLRFGANGEAAARTLSLVLPCTQLIRDNRQDATVDVVVGTNFTSVQPNADARAVLQQLDSWAAQHPAAQGGQQAQANLQPQVSPKLLTGAQSYPC